MASRLAIALRQQSALKRLEEATIGIADKLGVAAPNVPRQGRDAHLLYAQQLEVLADWAESVSGANSTVTPYDIYTNRELKAMVESRGLVALRNANKGQLIAMLMESEAVAV